MSSFYSEGSTWVSMGGGTTAVADAPATVQNTEQADNSTPLGRGIPKGVGVFPAKGEIVIDPDTLGGVRVVRDRLVVNLVLNFADTDLGGAASLVWLKANDEYIYRAETPQRQPTSPMRIYGGDQTAVDPLITEYMAAEYRTYWPGMAYVVLEDFDITGYDSQIPIFTAAWSTDATVSATSEADTTLNFGAISGSYSSAETGVDWLLGLAYQPAYLNTTDPVIFNVTDIETQEEIRRVYAGTGQSFDYIYFNEPLQGSGYSVCMCLTDGSYYGLRLLDMRTGEIVATLNAQSGTGGKFQPGIMRSVQIESGAATKYLIFCSTWASLGITPSTVNGNDGMIAVADVTNGTLEWIAGPEVGLIRGETGVQRSMYCLTVASVTNGVATCYFGEQSQGYIYKMEVDASGVLSVELAITLASSSPTGVAYDQPNNAVVYFTAADNVIAYDLDTASNRYTAAASVSSGALFVGTGFQSNAHELRPGYAMCYDGVGTAQYLVDLSDGSFPEIYDTGLTNGVYSMYRGVYMEPGLAGVIWFVKFGDLTPNAVDASDVLTKLETYFGDYVSGDLNFVNFTGSECKGYLVDQDTTIDACIRDVCETLGLREVHDNGKVNFVVPARDGSYSLEAALTDADITIDPIRQTIADEDKAFERVTLDYIDADNSYERASQEVARPNGTYTVLQSNKRFGASTGLCLTAAQAAKAAWRMMIESDFERKTYEFGVMPKKLTVQPTATISFTYGPDDDFTVIGEVREASISADFTQALRVNEFMAAIDSTVIGSSLVTVAPSYANATAEFVLLDTALLSYGDDAGGSGLRGYGVLIGAGAANIDASSAWRSSDGTTYTLISTRTDIAPVAGVISDTITRNYSDGFQTDYDAQLIVTVSSGDVATLTDCTEGQRYRNENYAAIGAQGRWVLISWSDVTVIGQVATFSEIIWGVNGTEVYLSSLAQGDRFINLETAEVVRFLNGSATLDSIVYYKGGYNGFLISALPTIAATADGEAEKPYAPVELAYSDAGSTRTITWEYRERKSVMPVLYGNESAGYSETSLAFEVDLLDGSGAVLTTLTATGGNTSYNTGTYSATSAKVYQMGLSGTLRGHAATLTF